MGVARSALIPLLVACVHHQEAATAAGSDLAAEVPPMEAAPESTPATAEPDRIAPAMHQYFWSTTDGRDLVVAGELEAARSAFARLLDEPTPETLPPGWAEGISDVRAVATEAAAATTIGEVAVGVARASALCGDCHAEHAGGPGVAFAEPPDLDDSLEGVMHRHVWAAERLWEGLVAPSDERWRAGVAAVFADPAMTDRGNGATDWALAGDIDAVSVASRDDRVAFYGDFIAACASCHQALGATPSEP